MLADPSFLGETDPIAKRQNKKVCLKWAPFNFADASLSHPWQVCEPQKNKFKNAVHEHSVVEPELLDF